jgi:ribosome-associated heat shock protein Hsp15
MADLEQFMTSEKKVRLDVWLWAARFFKTRSLCKQAIDGGKIELNGGRGKASKPVTIDDELIISRGQEKVTVKVLALAEKRGPASIANQLYEETSDSIKRRQEQAEIRRLNQTSHQPSQHRPDKKQRRQIHRFKNQF